MGASDSDSDASDPELDEESGDDDENEPGLCVKVLDSIHRQVAAEQLKKDSFPFLQLLTECTQAKLISVSIFVLHILCAC